VPLPATDETVEPEPAEGLAKSRRATALPPDERRSMIVAATLPLLLEHGDRVTSRQIADAAGIAEGTIFRVFAHKDELIAAVFEAALDPAPLEAAIAAIPRELSFEDALAAAIVRMQQRVIDIWRLTSNVGTRFHDNERRPMADSGALAVLFEMHRDRINVEPLVAARLLRALTLSTTHPMLAGEPKSPDEIVQLFLYGVSGVKPSC
jgi:AcrR family transcriptional regulator